MTDPIFVFLPSEHGEHVYVSLYQIVMVNGMTDDQMTLHLSDGNRVTVHGELVVEKLKGLLAQHAMTVEGQTFDEIADELPPEGPILVKPDES